MSYISTEPNKSPDATPRASSSNLLHDSANTTPTLASVNLPRAEEANTSKLPEVNPWKPESDVD